MTPAHLPDTASGPWARTLLRGNAAVGLLASMLVAGCSGAGTPVAGPNGPLGPERPPIAPLTANDAYPQVRAGEPATLTYRITDGQDAGQQAALTFTACDRLGALPPVAQPGDHTCLLWTVDAEATPRNTRIWTRAGSGLIAMGIMLNPERRVFSIFDPPLVVFPAVLEPGAPFTQTVSMKVTDERGRPKEQGTVTLETTLVAQQDLSLAGRSVETARVRSVFRANLKNARILRTTDRWHVPGVGPVMEHFVEEVRVFGLVVERTSQTFILSGEPSPPAADR